MNITEVSDSKRKWGNGPTSRTDFIETFLLESPDQLEINTWPIIQNDIEEFAGMFPEQVKDLGNNLKKLEFENHVFYWFEDNGNFVLGASLDKRLYALVVKIIGKNPHIKSTFHASDLYLRILKDSKKNIRLASDRTLSNSGYKIWGRLFQSGHTILVYNSNNPGEYIAINSEEEMKSFLGKGKANYQYILCESKLMMADIHMQFRTREYRRLAGLSLEDS